MITKKIFALLFSAICAIPICARDSYAPQAPLQKTNNVIPDWTGLTIQAQHKIVKTYAVALDSFARASVRVGNDTESKWAADTVHIMAQAVLSGKQSFIESMATIYKMQTYTGYGLSYVMGVMDQSRGITTGSNGSLGQFVANSIGSINSQYNRLANGEFSGVRTLSKMATHSLLTLQMYAVLYDTFSEEPAFSAHPEYIFQVEDEIDSLFIQRNYDRSQQFKVMSLIETPGFFWAVQPMFNGFATSEDEFNTDVEFLREYLGYISPYVKKVQDHTETSLTNEQFEEFMLKVTDYKAKMLYKLSKKMWTIPLDEQTEESMNSKGFENVGETGNNE